MNNLKGSRRPVILVFVRFYLPGYRAGGPVRSVSNLVQALGEEYDFRVVCLDRDLGAKEPYPNISIGQWHRQGNIVIRYVAPSELGIAFFKNVLLETNPDMIYLNSLFDRSFSIRPLATLGRGRLIPVLLTPRGELSAGALGIKPLRKRVFLMGANTVGLYTHVHWHACSEPEAALIQENFSPDKERISLASNLPAALTKSHHRHATKQPGSLRIVMASRIATMKNTLAAIRMTCQLPGVVTLDLWGPIEDAKYWEACQRLIAMAPSNISIRYQGEMVHEKLHGLLFDYDVMLLPTFGENFGHAIFEALAAELPVVISDRTPWRNLKSLGIGADLPLEDESMFVEELVRYQAMEESEMASAREACQRYVDAWCKKNAKLDDYRLMFNRVIASGHRSATV